MINNRQAKALASAFANRFPDCGLEVDANVLSGWFEENINALTETPAEALTAPGAISEGHQAIAYVQTSAHSDKNLFINDEHMGQHSNLCRLLREVLDHGNLPLNASLKKRIATVLENPLLATNAVLIEALCESRSVLMSVNSSPVHRINLASDDDPVYWQRQEWVTWAIDEVLPQVEAALVTVGFSSKPLGTSVATDVGNRIHESGA